MQFRQHAAHAAAADALDGGNCRRDHLRVRLQDPPLRRLARLRHAVVDSAMTRPPAGANSSRFAANSNICRCVMSTMSWPAARSRLNTALAVQRLRDRRAANHREPAADRHHDIGVIHRLRGSALGLEGHEFVVQQLRKFPEHIEIGARRQAGIGHAMRPIEHQAARALEKLSLRLAMREVDGARSRGTAPRAPLVRECPRAARARRLGASIGYSVTVPSP